MDIFLGLLYPILTILYFILPLFICLILITLIIMIFPKGRAFLKKLQEQQNK